MVIYRLPRGMSLSKPPSHCPACKHPIRWYHNLPILGWVILRGRCYDCQTPFSIRYPLVELATAILFVALGYVDVYRPALNLELNDSTAAQPAYLFAVYAADLLLGCTLLVATLIRYDRQRVPRRLLIPAVAATLLLLPLVNSIEWWPRLAAILALAALVAVPNRIAQQKRPEGPTGSSARGARE